MAGKAAAVRGKPVKGAKGAKGGKGKRRGGATLYIVVGTVLTVTAMPLCILIVSGLMPTAVAALSDRHPRRYLLRSVGALNLAGMVQPAMSLWNVGMSIAGAQHVLGQPGTWIFMYGAAALGAMVHTVMPSLARIVVDMRADQALKQLDERGATLAKEWGDEVKGEAEA